MKLRDIRPDPNQPRKIFDEKHIKGLATSILQEGIINPIEVDETGMIITGECRWRAAKVAGLEEVEVNLNKGEYNEYERLRHQMAENVHQSSTDKDSMMNPIDTAKGYARLLKLRTHLSTVDRKAGKDAGISALAREIGISHNTISEYLALLDEPSYILHALEKGLPRSYLGSTSGIMTLPENAKESIKRKMAKGEYRNREELIQEVRIAKRLPDLSLLEVERQRQKESTQVNRILNHIATLGLALEDIKFSDIDVREAGIVKKQLEWLEERIIAYLNPPQE